MKYKRGRLPPKLEHQDWVAQSSMLTSEFLDSLGPPPPSSNNYAAAVKVPWGMMGNDRAGDCVFADQAHSIMLRTANAGKIFVPTDQQVTDWYKQKVGWNGKLNDPSDAGYDEGTMCQDMLRDGWMGHKAAAVGAIDISSLDRIKWCIQLFGTCTLGLNLPGYAEAQFDSGKAWGLSATGDQSTGGHDVPAMHYDGDLFYALTWGGVGGRTGKAGLIPVTVPFLSEFLEEAHALLFPEWIRAQGTAPSGFDLAGLAARLTALAAS